MRKRAYILYSGLVQGVGFRWTAREIAQELAVCGWVRNLQDGRVEIEAEADEEVLTYFMDKMKQYFSRYIREEKVYWLRATNEPGEFKVKFDW